VLLQCEDCFQFFWGDYGLRWIAGCIFSVRVEKFSLFLLLRWFYLENAAFRELAYAWFGGEKFVLIGSLNCSEFYFVRE